MSDEAFDKLFKNSIYPANAVDYGAYESIARQWFEAGQSASAARIAELESEIENISGKLAIATHNVRHYSDRCYELEIDARTIAERLQESHRRHNCSLCIPNSDANCGKDCEVQHCHCPACIIAAKYK